MSQDDEQAAKRLKFSSGTPGQDPPPPCTTPAQDADIEAVDKLQAKLDEINDEALERQFEVEREFNKKRRPVYEERSKLFAKIPNFWMQTLLNHPLISQMVTDDDMKVLEYLTSVDVEEFEDVKTGYRITLHFSPQNPFFSEPSLVKEFHNKEGGVINVRGNTPSWKPGMAPAADQPDKSGAASEHDYRLMMWFIENESLEDGAHDPLADIVREEIWPAPFKYYNQEIDEYEDVSGSESQGEGEDFEGDPEEYDDSGLGGEDEEGSSEGPLSC